jgi:hypothetical protein
MLLWSIGVVELHLSDERFFALTPVEFASLVRRLEVVAQTEDYRSAMIACILANQHRGKNKKPYKITDFMPKRDVGEVGKSRRQTVDEQIAIAKAVTKAFGGTIGSNVK